MAITAATVKVVRAREQDLCQLCGLREFESGGGRFAIHHKRAKSMGGTTDPERDAPEHLALLHDRTCHPWVHANPRQAREVGLLESRLGRIRPSALVARREPA